MCMNESFSVFCFKNYHNFVSGNSVTASFLRTISGLFIDMVVCMSFLIILTLPKHTLFIINCVRSVVPMRHHCLDSSPFHKGERHRCSTRAHFLKILLSGILEKRLP